MRIKTCNDLHLEFKDVTITNDQNCDVLILSGDIMLAQDLYDYRNLHTYQPPTDKIWKLDTSQELSIRFYKFLERCSNMFPHVIYVAGNHEFYGGLWGASIDHLREICNGFSNVYFLEQDYKQIDDTIFIGATLWTDFNKEDSFTMWYIKDNMSDFRVIKNEYTNKKLMPIDVLARHKETVSYFKEKVLAFHDKKVVVVSHHGPTRNSIHPKYADQYNMNGGYSSDLSEFILDNPQIKLWTHGHTHDVFDYMVGDTRVVCNPRGYVGYEDTGFDMNLVIEI